MAAPKERLVRLLEELRHAAKIRRLQGELRRTAKTYGRLIGKAKKAKESKEAIDQVYWEWSQDDRSTEDEILQTNSNFLRQRAARLLVPYPEWIRDSRDYEESEITGKVRLTQMAQAALKKAIRQERKEAAEQWLMWQPVLSLIVAILGVTVAALAIITRH